MLSRSLSEGVTFFFPHRSHLDVDLMARRAEGTALVLLGRSHSIIVKQGLAGKGWAAAAAGSELLRQIL